MILDMLVRRKDHACALVKIDEETGLLVSGGVDGEDNLLDSVEFYNLETQEWQELSPLKKARTEHGRFDSIFFIFACFIKVSSPIACPRGFPLVRQF